MTCPTASAPFLFLAAETDRWAASVIPMAHDDAQLTVHRVEGDPPLLLLDERHYAPDPQRIRKLGLTRREGDVVMLAARGLSDVQIADRLFLSVRTVSKHLQ